jgi:hypothetical protein
MREGIYLIQIQWACWSRAFGPPLVPGVPQGPFPVYQCRLVVSSTSSLCLVPLYSAFGLCPSCFRAVCFFPPAPHGDGGAIRPVPLALFSHSLSLFLLFYFFALGLSLIRPPIQLLCQPSALCTPHSELSPDLCLCTSVCEH